LQLCHRLKRLISHAVTGLLALILSLAHPTAQAEAFNEYNLLLLDFTWQKQILAQSVTAYPFNDTIVISLAEAGTALEFPISVDAINGTANGWFIDEKRRFELDINANTVTIDGDIQPLEPNDAIVHEYSIYVPIETFSRWFPVDLSPELTTLSIKVAERETLPFQLRTQRRKLAGRRFVMTPPSLPEVHTPYQFLGPHTTDLSLGYFIRRETKPELSSADTSLTYSTLLRGDLAYMTSSIYLNGDYSNGLNYTRVTLSRERPDTPTGINLIEVGDIIPSGLAGVSPSNLERGLRIAGGTRDDTDPYKLGGNRTQINGDLLQGWEVELLHNGIRIDYQIAGPEGRYSFQDLELYYGTNTFELIFYGPAGERRTETISRYAGAETIYKDNLSYLFTVSQKGRMLYEPDASPLADVADPDTGRYTARLDYGLSSNFSIGSGWHSVVENGERLDYYSARGRAGWRDLYATIEATRDPETEGLIWDGAIHTPFTMRLWGLNTQLQHTQYATSVNALDETTDLQITSTSRIVLSGLLGKTASRFAANQNRLVQGSRTDYTADLSYNTDATRIGNTLRYERFSDLTTGPRPALLTGNLYLSSRFYPLDLRGNIQYQLKPNSEVLQYQLNANVYVAHDMNMYFGLDFRPITDSTLYSAGMNWRLKHVTLSPRLNYDSDGIYTGFIYATLSISPKPDRAGLLINNRATANSGGVIGRVFNDIDNDGTFSEGDTPLSGVSILAPQAFREAETDEHGSAYLMSLRPNKATDIQIDQGSLPDIAMRSSHKGNSVRPRAAQWTIIDFPVISTGEIDGKLYRQANGQLQPQPGMMIELRNANNDIVDFKISGQDGFFLFEHVLYGEYTVTLAEAKRNLLTHPAPTVRLNSNNPYHPGLELVITPAAKAPHGLIPTNNNKTIEPVTPTPIIPAAVAPVTPVPIQNAAGSHTLQLGAFSKRASAEAALTQWRQQYSKQLQGLELKIRKIDLGAKGIFYRVHAKGALDADGAMQRCSQLKQLRQGCHTIELKNITPP